MTTKELWVERVLVCCELVPPGRVAAYGDIGGIVGRGPRWIGNVLARHGGDVPWWRITNAAGDPPAFKREAAFAHWVREGIVVKENGRGCRIADFRTDLSALAEHYEGRMEQILRAAGLALPPLPAPARRALEGIGVRGLEELPGHRRADLAALHGLGARSLVDLDLALARAGLAYRP